MTVGHELGADVSVWQAVASPEECFEWLVLDSGHGRIQSAVHTQAIRSAVVGQQLLEEPTMGRRHLAKEEVVGQILTLQEEGCSAGADGLSQSLGRVSR